MTVSAAPLDDALSYAARGWPIFPCQWRGDWRKRPLLKHGLHDASADPAGIRQLWRRWPEALIGLPTGAPIGAVVLDIDVKRDDANGYDTLDAIGVSILPVTPMAHTASGGLHIYFKPPVNGLRNTGGARGRGIGPGIDWRGDGGYVIAPSRGSGYTWDPHCNLDTAPLADVPPALLPKEPLRPSSAKPAKPEAGLSPYAESALDSACRKLLAAPAGEQEATINGECFAIGTLAGAGGIPAQFARRALIWAARQIRSHDPRRPWHPVELDRKVERAFADGMRHPREAHSA